MCYVSEHGLGWVCSARNCDARMIFDYTKVIKTWPRGGRYIYMEYGYGEGELVCGATSDSSPVCEDGVVKHWVWIQIKLFIVQHNKKRNL